MEKFQYFVQFAQSRHLGEIVSTCIKLANSLFSCKEGIFLPYLGPSLSLGIRTSNLSETLHPLMPSVQRVRHIGHLWNFGFLKITNFGDEKCNFFQIANNQKPFKTSSSSNHFTFSKTTFVKDSAFSSEY